MLTLVAIIAPLLLSGTIAANAQTYGTPTSPGSTNTTSTGTMGTSTTRTSTTTVPRTPNTGGGASVPMNMALLATSALMVFGGMGYLARTR